ncbi:Cfem domain-containing protein [Pleurostoma richardsiae]|uniref:Cfem domain-containing protein n=1 Tax=Pleurostoma richardsiae TaxID=41990 RepID=A0AA38RGQ9_9PEZI|nr:Cfem domain-containing protein [Pleurostoma richardsiae]
MDDDSSSCPVIAPVASVLDIPAEPTSGLQTFAIFITLFFPALALVIVVIRNAGRFASHTFGWDDGLISIAMLLSVAETIVSYFFIKTNFIGIHLADVPPHDPTDGMIWNYAVEILYNPILALVKSSVLLFLLRLFGQKDGVRRFIVILNTLNIVQMVAFFFVIVFQCRPIAFNWDKTIEGGRCVDTRVVFTTTATLNIITDFLVLGLPLYIFVDLNIPKRTKLALLFVFLLGFLVTITSIVRMVIFVQGLFRLVRDPDPTFNIGFVTSGIETNLALITASAPALRPIFRSRRRGGWFPVSFYPKSQQQPPPPADPEMGTTITSAATRPGTSSSSGRGGGSSSGNGKFGSGTRGGRRPAGAGRGRAGSSRRKPVNLRDIRIRPIVAGCGGSSSGGPGGNEALLLRSQSPRGSEEETMTANGIMRVSDVQREIDGIVKDMAVGPGSYGSGRGAAAPQQPRPPTRRGEDKEMNGDSAKDEDPGRMRYPPERYYSESVYPDDNYHDRGGRDYNEERMSKYGDKRFGVVTPKMSTPRTPKGWGEAGRPF